MDRLLVFMWIALSLVVLGLIVSTPAEPSVELSLTKDHSRLFPPLVIEHCDVHPGRAPLRWHIKTDWCWDI